MRFSLEGVQLRTPYSILPSLCTCMCMYMYVHTVSVVNSIDIGATRREGGMGWDMMVLLLLLLLVRFVFCRPEI